MDCHSNYVDGLLIFLFVFDGILLAVVIVMAVLLFRGKAQLFGIKNEKEAREFVNINQLNLNGDIRNDIHYGKHPTFKSGPNISQSISLESSIDRGNFEDCSSISSDHIYETTRDGGSETEYASIISEAESKQLSFNSFKNDIVDKLSITSRTSNISSASSSLSEYFENSEANVQKTKNADFKDTKVQGNIIMDIQPIKQVYNYKETYSLMNKQTTPEQHKQLLEVETKQISVDSFVNDRGDTLSITSQACNMSSSSKSSSTPSMTECLGKTRINSMNTNNGDSKETKEHGDDIKDIDPLNQIPNNVEKHSAEKPILRLDSISYSNIDTCIIPTNHKKTNPPLNSSSRKNEETTSTEYTETSTRNSTEIFPDSILDKALDDIISKHRPAIMNTLAEDLVETTPGRNKFSIIDQENISERIISRKSSPSYSSFLDELWNLPSISAMDTKNVHNQSSTI